LVGRRHANEETATVNGDLHGGMAERRAGSGGIFPGTPALFRSRDNAPLVAAPDSARPRRQRALRVPI